MARKNPDPMADNGFYYCLKHNKVEAAGECPAKNRLGPYPTADEAALALHRVDERNDEWERQDRQQEN
jgi:hypothetical protein